MLIDEQACSGCGECVPYCVVGAISLDDDGIARVDLDECVECGACLRAGVCPTDAFYQQPLEWPRVLRAQFSDPLGVHPKTGIPGRGTEEIKTNDVTDRVKPGYAGMAVELGRPSVGARLADVEKVAMALSKIGVEHEPANPVTFLMTDRATGKMQDDVLQEKVFRRSSSSSCRSRRWSRCSRHCTRWRPKLDTVFSVDLACPVSSPTGRSHRQSGGGRRLPSVDQRQDQHRHRHPSAGPVEESRDDPHPSSPEGTREDLAQRLHLHHHGGQGLNIEGTGERMKKFYEIVTEVQPGLRGGCRQGQSMTYGVKAMLEDSDDKTIGHAVFRDADTVAAVIKDLIDAGFDRSVVVSGLFDEVTECCNKAGSSTPHTIEWSLGTWGRPRSLPPMEDLEVMTMCGHAQVPASSGAAHG